MKQIYTGKTRLFLAISGAIVVIALVLQIAGVGMNMGVDFTGGSLLNYSVGEAYDVADVEKILQSAGYEGSQITKAAPSEASIQRQMQLAMQADEAAEESAAEATLLDTDKSGIEDDGLTDLQIRLMLVDESEGLEEAVNAAVLAEAAGAEAAAYGPLTNSMIVEKDFDGAFAGGYIAGADGTLAYGEII